MSRKNIIFLAVAAVTVLIDQATKWWVYLNLEYGTDRITVIPGFFEIVHAQNPGAAGGMFGSFEYRYVLFAIFTLVAVGVIVNMQRQLADNLRFIPTTLGLILGGAVGNAIDRVHKQTVTDFLRFFTTNETFTGLLDRFGLPHEYPSFNIADAALVVGVLLFVVHYLFLDDGELDGKPAPASSEAPDREAPAEPS